MVKEGSRWTVVDRDDRGYRIPTPNTVSDAVYRLHNFGFTNKQIAGILSYLGINNGTIRTLMWAIRHPEKDNHYSREQAKKRRRIRKKESGTDLTMGAASNSASTLPLI